MNNFTSEEIRMIYDTDFFPAKAEIIRKFHEKFMKLRDWGGMQKISPKAHRPDVLRDRSVGEGRKVS
jgi:hypothetical protein